LLTRKPLAFFGVLWFFSRWFSAGMTFQAGGFQCFAGDDERVRAGLDPRSHP